MGNDIIFRLLFLILITGYCEVSLALSSSECNNEQLVYIEASMDNEIPSRKLTEGYGPDAVAHFRSERERGRKAAQERIDDYFFGANQVKNLSNAKAANESIQHGLQQNQQEQESYRLNPVGILGAEYYAWAVADSRLQLCISNLLVQELSRGRSGKK